MSEDKKKKEEYEIDLVEVIKKLWRNRILIIIITGVFMVIGIVYALTATPIYKSTLTMYPASGGEKMGGLMSMAASFGMSTGGRAKTYNIEDVVKSRTIAREIVLHKWKTARFDEPVNILRFHYIDVKDSVQALYAATGEYANRVSVETNKETGLMKLNVETEDPVLSAEIANYLGKAVTKYVQEFQGSETQNNIDHINKRLLEVKNELSNIEDRAKDFKLNNRDMSSPLTQIQYGRLERELQIKQQVYLTLNQQIELAQIEKIKKSPVINILDKAEVPLFKVRPKGSLICVVFTFLGGILGVLFVLIIPFLREMFGDFKLSKLVKA